MRMTPRPMLQKTWALVQQQRIPHVQVVGPRPPPPSWAGALAAADVALQYTAAAAGDGHQAWRCLDAATTVAYRAIADCLEAEVAGATDT
eukprot:9820386-Lingulodinium_polyedra.AAC.1